MPYHLKQTNRGRGPFKLVADFMNRVAAIINGTRVMSGGRVTLTPSGFRFYFDTATGYDATFDLYDVESNSVKVRGFDTGSNKVAAITGELKAVTGVDTEIAISAETYIYLKVEHSSGDCSIETSAAYDDGDEDITRHYLWYIPWDSEGGIIDEDGIQDLRPMQRRAPTVAVDSAAAPGYLGNSASSGVLRTDGTITYTDNGDYVTLGVAASNDEKVAVDSYATPDYIGNSSSSGVIRTDSTMTYTDGGDYVTLGVANPVPAGTYEGQVAYWDADTSAWVLSDAPNANGEMLVWDNTNESWQILDAPADDAVLVFDTTQTDEDKVQWETESTAYKVLQCNSSGRIVFDWVRAHS